MWLSDTECHELGLTQVELASFVAFPWEFFEAISVKYENWSKKPIIMTSQIRLQFTPILVMQGALF